MRRQLVPLHRVATINQMALVDNIGPEVEFMYADLASVDLETAEVSPRVETIETAPSRARRLTSVGDTLIPSLTGGNSWTSTRPLLINTVKMSEIVFSTGFFSVSSRSDMDCRFLNYALTSKELLGELEAVSNGVTMKGFTPAQLERCRVWCPSLDVQKAIADFLDSETARIDALLSKKEQLVELLRERSAGLVEQRIRALCDAYGLVPLKYRSNAIQVGIVVTPAAWYADEGNIALRGVNVAPGEITLEDTVRLTDEGNELHRKSILRSGDVVVVRTGQAGAAAVIPEELDGVNCIDLLVVRPRPDIHSRFLEYVLNSDWTQKRISEHSVGSIQGHFNVSSLKELPIPMTSRAVQDEVVLQLDEITNRLSLAAELLARQIELLREHRQALITAAVTGDLKIPGVAT